MDNETDQQDPEENLEGRNENQSQPVNTPKDSKETIRRRKNPSEVIDAGNVVKEALATFKSTLKRNEFLIQPTQHDDDCDLYGKLLAKKLRKLSEEKRLKLMHDIDGMFMRYQYAESPSLVPTPSPKRSPLQSHICNLYNQSHNLSMLVEPRPGTSSSTHSETAHAL